MMARNDRRSRVRDGSPPAAPAVATQALAIAGALGCLVGALMIALGRVALSAADGPLLGVAMFGLPVVGALGWALAMRLRFAGQRAPAGWGRVGATVGGLMLIPAIGAGMVIASLVARRVFGDP